MCLNNMRQHKNSLRRQRFQIVEPMNVLYDDKSDSDRVPSDVVCIKARLNVVSIMDKFKLSQKG